ncbi:MAG: 50S ribosomal protein L5 [Candidatus Pacearchaeota archaeon]
MIEENKTQSKMRTIKIEKIVLSIGAKGETLEKGYKLLERLTEKKPSKTTTKKRVPSLDIRPGLEIGAVSTVRKGAEELLKRMLSAVNNTIKKKQISENNFSFGIKEYIEIPGIEYQRDLGILGLDVTVVFIRAGRRVRLRKTKRSKIPARQRISREEIIKFMEENFQVNFE